jgi:RNA polymerase sigma-70 factor (ECF subfamily)
MNAAQFQKNLLGMQDNMMNFALKLTSNPTDAQDLMQDTSLRALTNQDKFADNLSFGGWLYTIMHHLFVNKYHKLVQQQAIMDTCTDIYNLDVVDDGSYSAPDADIRLSDLTKAIGCLPADKKEVFSMYLSGYKQWEIAERLNLPIGTVKSRIFFAKEALQKSMKKLND